MFNYRVKETTEWVRGLVERQESGVIIGLPMSGKLRTVQQSIEQLDLTDNTLYIDLSILPTKSSRLLQALEARLGKFSMSGGKIVYFDNALISVPRFRRQLRIVNSIRSSLKSSLSFIYAFNEDVTLYPQILQCYSYLYPLNQNQYFFAYSSPSELSALVTQNEIRYDTKLPKNIQENLYPLTSGVPFLVKSIYKNQQLTPHDIDTFVSQFTPSQIRQLLKPTSATTDSFHRLGLVDSSGKFYSSSIALAINNYQLKAKVVIDPTNSKVVVDNQDITSELTSYDQEILFGLVNSQRLSRQQIATICYGSQKSESYSDYAIDKIMSRLRAKLTSFGADKKLITVNRGFGYSLSKNDY